MFQFEKLNAFSKAVDISADIEAMKDDFDDMTKQQFSVANEVVVKMARASAQQTYQDKHDMYVQARADVHALAAVIILLNRNRQLTRETFTQLYDKLTQLSLMLYKLIMNYNKPAVESTNQ